MIHLCPMFHAEALGFCLLLTILTSVCLLRNVNKHNRICLTKDDFICRGFFYSDASLHREIVKENATAL